MTDALTQRLVHLLEAAAPADRARRQQLSDLYRVHWQGLCGYVRAQFGPGPPEPEDVAQSAAAENPVYELSPENVLLQAERFRIVAQALERMPLKRRRLVLLNRFEGLSYAQIGEQFGMSAENVRKHIERTLAQYLRALHE
jgi:RNA polymerase sigma factor (sigma-70 family)